MAKKPIPVTLWEARVCECKKCFQPLYIQSAEPQKGDFVTCPSCGQRMVVDALCSDCRSGDEPQHLEVVPLGT